MAKEGQSFATRQGSTVNNLSPETSVTKPVCDFEWNCSDDCNPWVRGSSLEMDDLQFVALRVIDIGFSLRQNCAQGCDIISRAAIPLPGYSSLLGFVALAREVSSQCSGLNILETEMLLVIQSVITTNARTPENRFIC